MMSESRPINMRTFYKDVTSLALYYHLLAQIELFHILSILLPCASMAIRAKHVKNSKNVSRQVDLRKNKLVFNIPKTMQICHPQSGRQAGKANHHPCLFIFLQVSLEQTSPSWKKRIVTSTVVSCLYLWYLLHWPLSWSTSESKLLSKYISMIMFDKLVLWTDCAISYYLPGKYFP